MKSGSLKHRVSFILKEDIKDDFGGVSNSEDEIYSCFASINTISGKESYLNASHFTIYHKKIRIRHTKKIDERHKIKFGDKLFEIEYILNIFEKNKELEIIAKEIR